MSPAAGALRARHLVLLGLPGAGKSTVGPLVAAALGRRFVDLDAEIERREQRSIAAIFATSGEAHFRALERTLTAELLGTQTTPVVLAAGGGWVEDPRNREWLSGSAFAVYLRVGAAIALLRLGSSIGARPLLEGSDPAAKLTELLRRREPLYLQSQYTVSSDSMTAEETASSIVALARAE